MYMAVLSEMAKHDFPAHWPDLVGEINRYLSQSDEKAVHTGLVALKAITKKYVYALGPDREPLNQVIETVAPFLNQLVSHLLNQQSELAN